MDKYTDRPIYYQGEHECIDVMKAMFGEEAVKAFCRCNSFKYRFRAGRKPGEDKDDDLKKAAWYEDYLMEMEGLVRTLSEKETMEEITRFMEAWNK